MRPIDADALMEKRRMMTEDKAAYKVMCEAIPAYLIDGVPTIDAVPVVRCKDCVHSAKLEGYHQRRLKNGLNCNACRGDNGYGIAKLSLTTPDGYCDYGLRRSSDANE